MNYRNIFKSEVQMMLKPISNHQIPTSKFDLQEIEYKFIEFRS